MNHPFIEGEKIYLRGLENKDLSGNYFQWLNDAVTCQYNSHAVFPNSEKKMADYFNSAQEAQDMVVFAIIEKEDDQHVGNISLQNIDWVSRNAEMAWIIGAESGGKGYGTAAGQLVIQYAFERLNLVRLYCGTSADNIAMQRVAEKLGMKKEGVREKAMYKTGKYIDVYEYGLLRNDHL